MSAAFTPGPWKVEETLYGSGRERTIYPEGRRSRIASIAGDPRSRDVNEANARLIAASPTMAGYIQRKADEGDEEAARIMEIVHAGR